MATELFRKRLIGLYQERRAATRFLAGFFTVRPRNVSDTETVSIDIVRDDEQISPVVNLLEGPTYNVADQFTTKEFRPPTISEAMPFDAKSLQKREAGVTEYEAADVSYQRQMISRILDGMQLLENKIQRNIEWQASQILQTGLLDLTNSAGDVVYQIDFSMKATHKITTAVSWTGGGGDPLQDLENASDLIRDDSLQDADRAIFGANALSGFLQNTNVQNQFNNRRMEIGQIAPAPVGQGAKFVGFVNVGSYEIEIWVYNGRGIPPGGTKIRMVDADNVILMASGGRLDTVFAGVPTPVAPDPRWAPFLPSRISVPMATDMSPNIYSTQNGLQTILEMSSRPLLIPTAIDSFAVIDTTV